MPERNVIERLDEAVAAILAGRSAPVIDPDVAMLAAIAADLRDLPDPAFREKLGRRFFVPVKPGLQTITPYFVVNGVAKFITFLEQAFGAKELARYPRPDGSIMHAALQLGDSNLEMGDATPQYPPLTMAMHLYVDDVDAVFERAVRAGATTLMGITDQFYGDREASLRDPFGNHWYIATHIATKGKPAGFRAVTPFLHPQGTDRLIDFLKRAFDAQELDRSPAKDGTIMHATMRIGDSLIEMGEAHGQWQPMPGNIHLYVEDADAAYQQAIDAGAKSIFAVVDQPYGERSGGVTDPFGNQWYVATPK
jgi:PhnB protein